MDNLAFESLDEIKKAVEDAGGVLSMYMWTLRDAHGADRLGKQVRVNISNDLHGLGLRHIPKELPGEQWSKVRIFKQRTSVAQLIDAVLDPSPENDESLRRAYNDDAQRILAKIRELVEG